MASANWRTYNILHNRITRKAEDVLIRKGRPAVKLSVPDEPLPGPSHTNKVRSKPMKANGESVAALKDMILDNVNYTETEKAPGKFVAIDCEMVGVGLNGSESVLARVSVVNFEGAVLLDEYVKPMEKVVDYRTKWSGIRPEDLVKGKPFGEVQSRVAALLEDKIVIGHAISNDFKALLLSHPHAMTRDTQKLAHKHKLTKSKLISLRVLVLQELGLSIQEGEHSSVTDARATLAVYRLHRRAWNHETNNSYPPAKRKEKKKPVTLPLPALGSTTSLQTGPFKKGVKRKLSESSQVVPTPTPVKGNRKRKARQERKFPGGGRRGVSSGLSVVVKHEDGGDGGLGSTSSVDWWKNLGARRA